MNMKDYLTKTIERKKAEAKELEARSDASESIEEVRAIGETLKKLRDEINDAEKALADVEADTGNASQAEVPTPKKGGFFSNLFKK